MDKDSRKDRIESADYKCCGVLDDHVYYGCGTNGGAFGNYKSFEQIAAIV